MRYIDVGGQVVPKNCKYGPRPAEGIVLNSLEWCGIMDHLVKEEREKEMAAVLKAKEEAKKDISFQMTKNWSNTLASIKTLSEQKRVEKREKEKQDKIDKYNEILKIRKEEKKQILQDVRKILQEERESSRTVKSGILCSLVLQERQEQIDLKKALLKEEKRKDMELGEKFRVEADEFKKEILEAKLKEKNKRKIQKEMLDVQMADIKLRRKAIENELAEEKKDLKNMQVEIDKIRHCNSVEKNYRKELAAKYIIKTQNQIEHERRLVLENEEEDEINKIYLNYARKFQIERKRREEQMMKEKVAQRTKTAEKLGEKLAKMNEDENDKLEEAEKELMKLEEEKERLKEASRLNALAEILEEKKKADEKLARRQYEAKEAMKWDVIQACRTAEVNQKWREDRQKRIKEQKIKNRESYDEQCKEKKDREECNESQILADDDMVEEDYKYCEAALDFVKQNNLPVYPVLAAIERVKKNIGPLKKKPEGAGGHETADGDTSDKKTRQEPRGDGCYCFKH